MKYLIALLVLLALAACGGTNPDPDPDPIPDPNEEITVEVPLPTTNSPLGTLDPNFPEISEWFSSGQANELTSRDERVTLIVPADFITSGSIQANIVPVTSSAPNGLGSTYLVSYTLSNNSTVDTTKSVFLEFDLYQNQDTDSADVAVVFQKQDGNWQLDASPQVNGTFPNRKVRIPFAGNADYALVSRYKIHPYRAAIKTNSKLPLTVLQLEPITPGAVSAMKITPVTVTNWAVSSPNNGASEIGSLTPDASPNKNTYQAPATKPNQNLVQVTAQFNTGKSSKAGNKIVSSTIPIQNHAGWADFDVSAYWNKSKDGNNSYKYNGELRATYTFTVLGITSHVPQTFQGQKIPGSLLAEYQLQPKSTGTAKIEYEARKIQNCICTPKEGVIITEAKYQFTAAGDVKLLVGDKGYAVGEIQENGDYVFKLANTPVVLEGDYSYSFKETYPCGDRAPKESIDRTGKDTLVFALGRSIEQTGTVKPKGPDKFGGIGYDSTKYYAQLPQKELDFRDVTTFNVFSWYFPYRPTSRSSAKFTPPAAVVTPTPFTSPVPASELERDNVRQPRC